MRVWEFLKAVNIFLLMIDHQYNHSSFYLQRNVVSLKSDKVNFLVIQENQKIKSPRKLFKHCSRDVIKNCSREVSGNNYEGISDYHA